MKPFNLEDAKKGCPVCTRDGRKVRIVCFDYKNDGYPIIALVETNGSESIFSCTTKGEYVAGCSDNNTDLMMAGEKKEGWINIYGAEYSKHIRKLGNSIYPNEQDAIKEGKTYRNYITTIKIEWEEE